jgi:septal ring factor EnvC (AmiA/AmiB activator)
MSLHSTLHQASLGLGLAVILSGTAIAQESNSEPLILYWGHFFPSRSVQNDEQRTEPEQEHYAKPEFTLPTSTFKQFSAQHQINTWIKEVEKLRDALSALQKNHAKLLGRVKALERGQVSAPVRSRKQREGDKTRTFELPEKEETPFPPPIVNDPDQIPHD